jgi:hypothetical protein
MVPEEVMRSPARALNPTQETCILMLVLILHRRRNLSETCRTGHEWMSPTSDGACFEIGRMGGWGKMGRSRSCLDNQQIGLEGVENLVERLRWAKEMVVLVWTGHLFVDCSGSDDA